MENQNINIKLKQIDEIFAKREKAEQEIREKKLRYFHLKEKFFELKIKLTEKYHKKEDEEQIRVVRAEKEKILTELQTVIKELMKLEVEYDKFFYDAGALLIKNSLELTINSKSKFKGWGNSLNKEQQEELLYEMDSAVFNAKISLNSLENIKEEWGRERKDLVSSKWRLELENHWIEEIKERNERFTREQEEELKKSEKKEAEIKSQYKEECEKNETLNEKVKELEKERDELTKKVSDYQASEKKLLDEKVQLQRELGEEREAHLAGVDGVAHFHREAIEQEKEKREKLEKELSNLQNDYQQLKQEISQQKEVAEELNRENQLQSQEEKIVAYCEQIKK